jgi:hypothetical protein
VRILKYVEGKCCEDFNCTELSQYTVDKWKFLGVKLDYDYDNYEDLFADL